MSEEECTDKHCCCHNPNWHESYRYSYPNTWGVERTAKGGLSYQSCPDCGWGSTPRLFHKKYPVNGTEQERKAYLDKLIKYNRKRNRFQSTQIKLHRKFFCKDGEKK